MWQEKRTGDPLRECHEVLQGLRRRIAGCFVRDLEGGVRLPRRGLGIGQDHDAQALAARRGRRHRPDLGRGQGNRPALELESALSPPQSRLRVPGFPTAAEQDRLRERRLRPRSHRAAPTRDPHAGAASARTGRTRPERRPTARSAVRRRAAARGDRTGLSSTARSSSSPTSPPAMSTRRRAKDSCRCWTGSIAPGPRS